MSYLGFLTSSFLRFQPSSPPEAVGDANMDGGRLLVGPVQVLSLLCSAMPGRSYSLVEVSGFKSMYNNMHHPSKLTPGYDFYLFKENIEPKWEDPVCATGGKWTMTFSNGESDRSWMDMLQALVKEEFKHRDEICGAVVNVRNGQESIALWTKNATNEAAQVSIGKQWKGFLDSKETIVFTIHAGQDDASQVGSTATNLYTV
uniref:eukaryotic translation initiation factor 4E-1-like n=1 Tax=Fragaria vesca subsp. vesca TaxID=101020 RepID=UPI0005C815DE|nr:PREDICTED: eukaryotic translation initiation factor 4E-1-like [Fragaria vesca subsp. vesca]